MDLMESKMRDSLSKLGFILVKNVFSADEIELMSNEIEERKLTATVDDKRSWWATDKRGDEHCCRVTYLNEGSKQVFHNYQTMNVSSISQVSPRETLPWRWYLCCNESP